MLNGKPKRNHRGPWFETSHIGLLGLPKRVSCSCCTRHLLKFLLLLVVRWDTLWARSCRPSHMFFFLEGYHHQCQTCWCRGNDLPRVRNETEGDSCRIIPFLIPCLSNQQVQVRHCNPSREPKVSAASTTRSCRACRKPTARPGAAPMFPVIVFVFLRVCVCVCVCVCVKRPGARTEIPHCRGTRRLAADLV